MVVWILAVFILVQVILQFLRSAKVANLVALLLMPEVNLAVQSLIQGVSLAAQLQHQRLPVQVLAVADVAIAAKKIKEKISKRGGFFKPPLLLY